MSRSTSASATAGQRHLVDAAGQRHGRRGVAPVGAAHVAPVDRQAHRRRGRGCRRRASPRRRGASRPRTWRRPADEIRAAPRAPAVDRARAPQLGELGLVTAVAAAGLGSARVMRSTIASPLVAFVPSRLRAARVIVCLPAVSVDLGVGVVPDHPLVAERQVQLLLGAAVDAQEHVGRALLGDQLVGVQRVGEDAQVVRAVLRDVDGEVEHDVGAGAQPADVVAAGGVELRHVGGRALGAVAAVARAGVGGVLRLVGALPEVPRGGAPVRRGPRG